MCDVGAVSCRHDLLHRRQKKLSRDTIHSLSTVVHRRSDVWTSKCVACHVMCDVCGTGRSWRVADRLKAGNLQSRHPSLFPPSFRPPSPPPLLPCPAATSHCRLLAAARGGARVDVRLMMIRDVRASYVM